MLMTAFGMFATPFCKKALVLVALVSSVGVSMGILDTGESVHCTLNIHFWRLADTLIQRD